MASCLVFVCQGFAQEAPVCQEVAYRRATNGSVLVDDSGWLRERSSPEVHQYLEAENAYAEAATANEKPFADKLYSETLAHIKHSDVTFAYDVKSKQSALAKEQETPGFDKSLYAVDRIFLPAKDGVGVPTTVLYRKDKFHKGENPLYVYGYGSYGVTIPDTFTEPAAVA